MLSSNKDSFVCTEFKQILTSFGSVQASARELSNLFIWSAKQYYMRYPEDSYIVFSPVKYFKSVNLISLKCEKGFAFNRRFFHASDSVISCIWWSNTTINAKTWELMVYDIQNNEAFYIDKILKIKYSRKSIVSFNDKRVFASDIDSDVVCNSDGTEAIGWKHRTKHSK